MNTVGRSEQTLGSAHNPLDGTADVINHRMTGLRARRLEPSGRSALSPVAMPESPEDLARSHLYDLAERVATEITLIEPDWCQIAREAAEIATTTRAWCLDETT